MLKEVLWSVSKWVWQLRQRTNLISMIMWVSVWCPFLSFAGISGEHWTSAKMHINVNVFQRSFSICPITLIKILFCFWTKKSSLLPKTAVNVTLITYLSKSCLDSALDVRVAAWDHRCLQHHHHHHHHHRHHHYDQYGHHDNRHSMQLLQLTKWDRIIWIWTTVLNECFRP